jgi:hypothetical protein
VQKPACGRGTRFARHGRVIRRLVATLVVFAGGLWPIAADACSCGGSGLACDAAWSADAVFVGHVVSIESTATAADFRFRGRRTELAVVEAFRGLQLSQVTLAATADNCDFPFQMGQSYVVYAHRGPDGQLSTSICARTRPLAQANDDLAYLRSLAAMDPSSPARVDGRVQLFEWPAPPGGQLKPAPGITVTATGGARTVSARTNARGEFRLNGLAVGTYELKATAPDGYESGERTWAVHDPRGCGTAALFIRHDARVTGRVVDGRGDGVRGLPLELVRAEEFGSLRPRVTHAQAWTGADGTFEFRLLQPGDYLLAFSAIRPVNGRPTMVRALHPGVLVRTAATSVALAATARVRLQDFVVPESITLATISGIVVDEAGSPVRRARIVLQENTEGGSRVGPSFVTAEDGRFVFSLIERARYVVHVTRSLGDERRPTGTHISQVPITVAPSTPLVTVVMKPSRD